jgi:hypothetical protein
VYSGVNDDHMPETVRTSPSRTAGSNRRVSSPARCASAIARTLAALLATIASIRSWPSARKGCEWTVGPNSDGHVRPAGHGIPAARR